MNDTQTTETQVELLAELNGAKCRCGKKKQTGNTFCSRCYHALPFGLQGQLYLRFGQGYEAVYARCAKKLDAKGSGRA